jgi:hypothetical protein
MWWVPRVNLLPAVENATVAGSLVLAVITRDPIFPLLHDRNHSRAYRSPLSSRQLESVCSSRGAQNVQGS